MDKLVDLDKHEPDSLDVYVNRLSPDQLKSSQAAAVRTRFLELGSLLASQAATISYLEHRLKDVESLAHSHPKSLSRVLTNVDLEALMAAIESAQRRIDDVEEKLQPKLTQTDIVNQALLRIGAEQVIARLKSKKVKRGQTKKRKR